MKKLSFFLMAMLISVLSFAETYSLTPNKAQTGLTNTSYITTLTDFEYNGVAWKMNQWNPSSLQVKTNQSSAASEWRFYNTSAFPGKITKVVIKFSALTLKSTTTTGFRFVGGATAVTTTTGGTDGVWNASEKTLTWTPNAEDNFTYFALYQNGKVASGTNNLATSDAIVVTYEAAGGSAETIVKTLKSIAVEGMTTTYEQGDIFKFDGTCTATYSVTKNDEPQADETRTVTPTVSTPNMEQIGTQTIEVSYKEGEVSVSTTYDITITENIITPGTYTSNLNNTFFNCTAGNQSAEQSGKFNDILVAAGCKANAQNKTYYDAAHVRFYTDSYLTLSVPTGYVIKSIVFTAGGDWKGSITASTGTYNNDTKSWSGYEQEVQFSFGQQNRIASISVTYEVLDLTHVAVPTISGTEDFSESATVTIAAEDGLKVYYTLDGTDPTNASTEYTAPFELTATTTVKAIAYNGENASDIASKTFTKCQVLTCQEAKDLCTSTQSTDKYAIRGYITSIPYAYSSTNNNISFWMADTKDGGEVFEGYKAVPADNAAKSVKVGDYVELIGHIVLYNSTPETTQGGTYTVIPAPVVNHTITVSANPTEAGTVTGGGEYEEGTKVTLTATPNFDYEFEKWSNGATENPLTITVTKDETLEAIFVEVAATKVTKSGEFSISDHKLATFATGNLQYHTGDKKWRFAKQQYQVVGEQNINLGNPEFKGWIDMLGWSADGKFGVNPSNNNAEYAEKFVDWGTLFPAEENWSTLSKDEWKYLLETRTNAKNLQQVAMVDTILGILLFPDKWTALEGCEPEDKTYEYEEEEYQDYNFNYKHYTLDQWTELEAAGAVFLPAAGRRTGGWGNTTISPHMIGKVELDADGHYKHYDNNNFGAYYWTNTINNSNTINYVTNFRVTKIIGTDTIYSVGAAHPYWGDQARCGLSVRLAKVAYDTHIISVIAENGTVTGDSTYTHGTTATLTATPAEGYEFTCWTVGEDTVSTANPYSFIVEDDMKLVANFKEVPTPPTTTITASFDLVQEDDTRNMGGTYSIYAGDYTLRIFGYEGAGTYQDDTTTVEDAAPLLFTPDYDDPLNPVVVVTIDEENNKEVMQVTAASADGKKIYKLTINIALPSYETFALFATGIQAENGEMEGTPIIRLKGEGYLGEETVPFNFMVYETMEGYAAEGSIGEIYAYSTEAMFFVEEGSFTFMATMQDEEMKYLFKVEMYGTMAQPEVEIVVKETKDVTLYNLNMNVQGNMAMVTAEGETLSFWLTLLETENYYGTYTNDAFSNIWYGDEQLYAAYGDAHVYSAENFKVSFISQPDAEGNVTLYNFTLIPGDKPAEPTKHTVTILVSSEGAGTVTGAGEYEDGAEVTVTATANKGWIFYGWLDEDGECLSNDDNYTFQVLDDVTLTAYYLPTLEGISTDCVINGNKITGTAQLSVGLLKMNLVLGEEEEEDVFVLTEESTLTINNEEVILEDGRFMDYDALVIAAFIAVYKDVPHYITVMIVNPTTTGVDNINTTVAPVKMIENGQLIIMKGDAKYNVQGAIIK